MTPQVVILGAGRPHRGVVPAALRTDRAGIPALEWLVDALGADLSEVVFVGGYRVDEVRARYPQLTIRIPQAWERTGSAASLLAAPFAGDRDVLVAYSDVLVRPELVAAVRAVDADIVVGWDSHWRERFAGRRASALEALEKVVVADDELRRLGEDIRTDEAAGEFIGIVRFSQRAAAVVARVGDVLVESLPARAHLSRFVNVLRTHGLSIAGVDARGDWAEIDEPADIAHFVLGTKADSLARLKRLVTRSQVADQVTFSVRDWSDDPDACVREVERAFGDRRLIVRSSTTHEDAFDASNAGGFSSVLGVVRSDLLQAVRQVVDSYRSAGIDVDPQQVLVQPLIEDVVTSGVAFTRTLEHAAPWYVIEFSTDGDTSAVTSGSAADARTLYLRRRSRDDEARHDGRSAAPRSTREVARMSPLIDALQEIEVLLGHDALDVEFAIDGDGIVHLLQARPAVPALTAPRRDEVFAAAIEEAHDRWAAVVDRSDPIVGAARPVFGVMPDWNPAEIIGTAPGRLALDLYRFVVTDDVWAQQRAESGYQDLRPRPLLVDFAGRPYVDVRASFASFIPAKLDSGLASRLLAAAIDRLVDRPELHDKVEFAVIPTCVSPDWSRWAEVLAGDGLDDGAVGDLEQALTAISRGILARVDDDLATVAQLEQRARQALAGVDGPLRRAAVLLDLTRAMGTLPFAHLARAAFVAVAQVRGAETVGLLSTPAAEAFFGGIRSVSQELTAEASEVADGRRSWDAFVDRWGHLRPGTYDITSPRYDADPERFLRPMVRTVAERDGDGPGAAAWLAERGSFLAGLRSIGFEGDGERLERSLRRAVEGREWAKAAFTRTLSDALEEIARGWEVRGLSRDELAEIPLSELLPDASDATSDPERLRELAAVGRERRQTAAALPMAALLTGQGDLDAFVMMADTPNFVGPASVIAQLVELTDDARLAAADLRGRIVMIPRADPGYDWLFGCGIAGLVTLYGGANSHMAIRAAEHGMPAAIGIGEQRYRALQGAHEVEIDPRGRTLRPLG